MLGRFSSEAGIQSHCGFFYDVFCFMFFFLPVGIFRFLFVHELSAALPTTRHAVTPDGTRSSKSSQLVSNYSSRETALSHGELSSENPCLLVASVMYRPATYSRTVYHTATLAARPCVPNASPSGLSSLRDDVIYPPHVTTHRRRDVMTSRHSAKNNKEK